MQSKAKTVKQYLAELPADRREALQAVREVILKNLSKGYEEAQKALSLSQDPLDKFTASYAMAYSLAFHVTRDNEAMLGLLKEARSWFEQLPGATPEAWAYLLQNDTLKGFVETDPSFQSLLAASAL